MASSSESPGRPRADGYNAGYAEQLAERQMRERGLIPPSLADWMGNGGATAGLVSGAGALPDGARAGEIGAEERLRTAAVAAMLVEAHRDFGHLAVQLDPLGSSPPGHPALSPEFYGVKEEDLAGIPASVVGRSGMGRDVLEVVRRLRRIYCGRIGYELDQMENPAQRDWLVDYIESGRHRHELSDEEAVALLERLSEVEGLEQFLQRSYLGQKRFSIEGLDMLVPMLDEMIERSARAGTREILLGMAHRGRLNVLAHIIGRPYEAILAEFEGSAARGLQTTVPEQGSGDVKYHLGASGSLVTEDGEVRVVLAPNPSHLEHVNPVVEGMARAARETRSRSGEGGDVLAMLIHGDAAFIGEGIVAETLNLCRLEAYDTGGTIHLIANNQLGFTTRPEDGRSTRYASDLALGFRIPVVHVNADDPEACLAAVRLAVDYRGEFGEDILIDLVGYRRHGHNEGDEPAYTQPQMYERIEEHPTVRALWARALEERGVVDASTADGIADRIAGRLSSAREEMQAEEEPGRVVEAGGDEGPAGGGNVAIRDGTHLTSEFAEVGPGETAVPEERLRRLNAGLHQWPPDFELVRKLARQLERRRDSLDEGLDWAHAEALAFGSLVTEDVPIRMTGEDTERGTFSQRHLVLHDAERERLYVPLQHLSGGQAPFEIYNSPLSEAATIGFEYGYSTVALGSLVLWEAQFGDFANVGEAMIDQFIAAGRSKWGQESRLVLLLPHGYEGMGPEHSSARLERYLQLAAQGNLRVAYPTTPAQYFHLLRGQALREARRPLIVMTPKSLLRHPRARSTLAELSEGAFRPVLGDASREGGGETVRRLILCTGKLYYDLATAEEREKAADTSILRIERLYPFPEAELREALGELSGLESVVWAQEEPENMGAWGFVEHRLRALLAGGPEPVYVGRPEMASPAEGYASAHEREQRRIVREALEG